MPLAISELVAEANKTATEKGWHAPYKELYRRLRAMSYPTDSIMQEIQSSKFGSWMALITSEVSEALEAYRSHGMKKWYRDSDSKPEGVAAELADVVIRVADVCGELGIDLEAAIVEKMEFNKSRAHRHGGKKL